MKRSWIKPRPADNVLRARLEGMSVAQLRHFLIDLPDDTEVMINSVPDEFQDGGALQIEYDAERGCVLIT